ncbi:MAG: dihydrodipicolinate synthase family protein [Clostridia bacterium]|nr:dihydrodipicolinate synthase family protein [Clostridia bacterium]
MIRPVPNGVYPTMITPYTDNNEIDYNAVLQILQWYTEKGVTAVFAICQSSEIFFLSFEERLELLRFIMRNKPAGMIVVASGNTSADPDTILREAEAFIETGIDGYVFIANRFAAEDEPDEVLAQRMLDMAERLPQIPLGVYECPYPYKRVLTPDVLRLLSSNEKFCFLKDTCCDIGMIEKKLEAVKNGNLKIFNANSATLLPSLKLGCAGFSGVMANFHPELYVKLCSCFAGEPEKARRIQDLIGTLSMAECQCYPVNAKYYLSLEGLTINTFSRSRSGADFGPSRKAEIEEMRAVTKLFEETLL